MLEAQEGFILSAFLSFTGICLSTGAIVLIFLMKEKKKIFALNLIRLYLWLSIPYGMLAGVIGAAEYSDPLQLISVPVVLMIGLPIAIYWQQKAHSNYLHSYMR